MPSGMPLQMRHLALLANVAILAIAPVRGARAIQVRPSAPVAKQVPVRRPEGSATPQARGSELVVVATDFHFEAPEQVDAGLVHLRLVNRGRKRRTSNGKRRSVSLPLPIIVTPLRSDRHI